MSVGERLGFSWALARIDESEGDEQALVDNGHRQSYEGTEIGLVEGQVSVDQVGGSLGGGKTPHRLFGWLLPGADKAGPAHHTPQNLVRGFQNFFPPTLQPRSNQICPRCPTERRATSNTTPSECRAL